MLFISFRKQSVLPHVVFVDRTLIERTQWVLLEEKLSLNIKNGENYMQTSVFSLSSLAAAKNQS